jgi:hypothetical protein
MFTKILKTVTGIHAYQDRQKAKLTLERAAIKYKVITYRTEKLKSELNKNLQSFGILRLSSLKKTIGIFSSYLKDMEQKCKEKEYQILDEIGFKADQLAELPELEMNASRLLLSTTGTSLACAVALTGVPAVVTAGVGALAVASTGTAISSLSGVAATNATLAWLGCGSLAAGGGGMAAGAVVLGTITTVSTAGIGVIVASLIATSHYSKRLTEARKYDAEVDIVVEKAKKAWVVINGINTRVNELSGLTSEITNRTLKELKYLSPLVPDFDKNDLYQIEVFQKSGLLVKSVSELSKAGVLDEQGEISKSVLDIMAKTRTILNTNL